MIALRQSRQWLARGSRDSLTTALFMAVAAIVLGIGSIPLNPNVATVFVSGALVVAGLALILQRETFGASALTSVIAAGVLAQGLIMAILPAFQDIRYQAVLVVLTLLGTHATLSGSRWRNLEIAVVLAGYCIAMFWMLASTEAPAVDVILFQQEGSAALLHGVNPFAMRFENIYYGAPVDYYSPEVLEGRQLAFGFIYPPLSLLLAVPGYLIAGDYRYGAVLAVGMTAALTAFAQPGRVATGAAMLILFAPVTQIVLFGGWTEPFVVVMLAATMYLAARASRGTPIALGLLLATKQYAAPVLILGWVLLRAVRARVGGVRLVLVPVLVAVATVIPFAVWDLGAMIHSTVTVHFLQPFRIDGLTIPAQIARAGGSPPSELIGLTLSAVTLVVVLWRAPRTVAGFCFATGVFLLVFFLFNKQAFLHYYFFVLVAFACGVASTDSGTLVPATQSEGTGDHPPRAAKTTDFENEDQ